MSNGFQPKRQTGFSIVEIMIAMTIGLFVVAGLAKILTSNKESYRVQEAQSVLQENARLATVFLSTSIGKAGFHQDAQVDASSLFPAGSVALTGTNDNADGTDNILDGSDTITVRFEGDGVITDCLGATVGASAITTDVFRVDTNNQLQCSAGGGAFQPLLDNVQGLQILYGEDTGTDAAVDQYRNAGSVINFDQVFSVHVALLLASDNEIKPNAESNTYTLLDTTATMPPSGTDRLQRRVIERVVALRNRLP